MCLGRNGGSTKPRCVGDTADIPNRPLRALATRYGQQIDILFEPELQQCCFRGVAATAKFTLTFSTALATCFFFAQQLGLHSVATTRTISGEVISQHCEGSRRQSIQQKDPRACPPPSGQSVSATR